MDPDGASLTIGDVYFTLFRHKFKIIFCALLGLAAAFAFFKIDKRIYQSEAKLFIRYVMESRTPGRSEQDGSVKMTDPGGYNILNSELEIITSFDLAGKVVDTVGISKFIDPMNDGKDRDRAVYEFSKNFKAQVPESSSILQLTFSHSDPTIVQPVLREAINSYLKKHVEIHRTSGLVDDFLTQETEQLRSRLAQTEEDLRKAKSKVGYASIEDGKKTLIDLATRLRQDIFTAETELAERSAFIGSVEPTGKSDGAAGSQNNLPSDDAISAYSAVLARLEFLRKAEQELLVQFTAENNRVKETRAQRLEAEAEKRKLEEESPTLSILHPAVQSGAQNSGGGPADIVMETARVKALQSRIGALNEQLKKLRTEVNEIDSMEAVIVELNRKKELEETNYRKFAASLEQARLDEAMSSGSVSNISEIQSPSLPIKSKSSRPQIMAALALGGLGLGLAWAFAIELFFDKTIRRPGEIERHLNLPLFLSIPVVDRAFRKRIQKVLGLDKPSAAQVTPGKEGKNPEPAKKAYDYLVTQALQPFHATLRDRVIGYFDNRNLTHKPKLIAVTGLARKSGISSTAAGIARSLSETEEGNVLLVNMNPGEDAARQFSQGQATTQLDDLLEKKTSASSDENLFIVTEGSNSDMLLRNLPQRFSKMLPKLKSSDFDYIIFDMPTVSQISITPRLAGYMDIVLLVLESEKTDREIVQKASALLAQSKAEVGVVLNKTRTYIPPSLYQESLGDL